MVRVAGYDPATSCFPSKRATRLRHTLSLWVQSGRKDLNPRPLVTETSALPDCATPRLNPHRLLWPPAADGSYPDTDYYPCQTLFLRTYGAPATRRVEVDGPPLAREWCYQQGSNLRPPLYQSGALPTELWQRECVLKRGQDLNLRPRRYERRELPDCSTPHQNALFVTFSTSLLLL